MAYFQIICLNSPGGTEENSFSRDSFKMIICEIIRQLKAKHNQIILQWIPGHSLISGNEYADTLAKNGAKITQKHIRETSYRSIKLHFKQVFQSAYRPKLGTKLSQKPWKQELAKIPDWPRRKAVAEFRLCVGHDCLGTHLHRIEIRPDPYCMLCGLHETMDRNHLGRCTALSRRTECERYWEAWKTDFSLLYCYFFDYSLSLGLFCLL
jgi:hypothetical protein